MNDTWAEARAVIEAEKQARVERVRAGLETLLKDERCIIDVVMILTSRGNAPQVQFMALD